MVTKSDLIGQFVAVAENARSIWRANCNVSMVANNSWGVACIGAG
jgi:hypothetical protein